MPRKKRHFINNVIYHIVLRRIENELLFNDINDYYRAIFYIYECKQAKPVIIRERRRARDQFKKMIKSSGKINLPELHENFATRENRDFLVEILLFCLMPNHIHLLIRQLKDAGITKFVQKIAGGYPAYFKNKYKIKLKGHFFQDRFSVIPIETEEQLRIVFTYIHTNPIAIIEPEWKEKGIKNIEEAIKFLENYKWSSCQDYLGKKNFPSVTERDFMLKIMSGEKGCREWVEGWLKYKKEIRKEMEKFKDLFLEK